MHADVHPQLTHPFDRSGLACVSDLATREWRDLFASLERDQAEFLRKETEFRSPDYLWPRDPLHTWSRVWEYPYAYHHLREWRQTLPTNQNPRVVDLGSGVTFFPFTIARLGCDVTCADTDPIAQRDVERAAACVAQLPGRVDFRRCDADGLPFETGEVDAVFCISVLEHIPEPDGVIGEIARILKPNGLLVLTIDLDLRGDREIGVSDYGRLIAALRQHFVYICPDSTIHPADALDTTKGPYPIACPTGLPRYRFLARERLRRWLGKKPLYLLSYHLAVQGFVLAPAR